MRVWGERCPECGRTPPWRPVHTDPSTGETCDLAERGLPE